MLSVASILQPTWVHFGTVLAPILDPSWLQNSAKNRCHLVSIFGRLFVDIGTKLVPNLGRKMFVLLTYVSFWGHLGAKMAPGPPKSLSGSILYRFWTDFKPILDKFSRIMDRFLSSLVIIFRFISGLFVCWFAGWLACWTVVALLGWFVALLLCALLYCFFVFFCFVCGQATPARRLAQPWHREPTRAQKSTRRSQKNQGRDPIPIPIPGAYRELLRGIDRGGCVLECLRKSYAHNTWPWKTAELREFWNIDLKKLMVKWRAHP